MKRLKEQDDNQPAKRQLPDLSVYADLWLVILPLVFPIRNGFPLDELDLGTSVRLVCKQWDDLVKRAFVARKLAVLERISLMVPSTWSGKRMGGCHGELLRREMAAWKIGIDTGDWYGKRHVLTKLLRPEDPDRVFFVLSRILTGPEHNEAGLDALADVVRAMLACRADNRFLPVLGLIPYELLCSELMNLRGTMHLALRSDILLGWLRLLSRCFPQLGAETGLLGKFSAVPSFGRRTRLFLDIAELFPEEKAAVIQRILAHQLARMEKFSPLVIELFKSAPELVEAIDWRYVSGASGCYAGLMSALFRYLPQGTACVVYNRHNFSANALTTFQAGSLIYCNAVVDYLGVSLEKAGDLPPGERVEVSAKFALFKSCILARDPAGEHTKWSLEDRWGVWARRDRLDPIIFSTLLFD